MSRLKKIKPSEVMEYLETIPPAMRDAVAMYYRCRAIPEGLDEAIKLVERGMTDAFMNGRDEMACGLRGLRRVLQDRRYELHSAADELYGLENPSVEAETVTNASGGQFKVWKLYKPKPTNGRRKPKRRKSA